MAVNRVAKSAGLYNFKIMDDEAWSKDVHEKLLHLPHIAQLKALNTKNKKRADCVVTINGIVGSTTVKEYSYSMAFVSKKQICHECAPLPLIIYDAIYGHCRYSMSDGETYGYITNLNIITEDVLELIRREALNGKW